MFKLCGGVQRVHVHGDETSADRTQHGNRVLQQIGHHEGDTVAFFHARQALKVGTEIAG